MIKIIYTLTTNPAIDVNFSTKNVAPSVVNRCENTKYIPNGKGVNVSYVLKHYSINSEVLGFFGGFSGRYILDELNADNIATNPIWIDGITRMNFFIQSNGEEYKFVNKGPIVSKKKQNEFLDLLKELNDCEYLSISGSLPDGIENSYYKEILNICKLKSIKVILDISSPILKELLEYNPLLIKPNDDEIKDVFNIEINNEEDVKSVLKLLYKQGAQNILLTLGEKGMYFYNGSKIYYCSPNKIKLFSSACAGDAALAAFLSEWLLSGNIELAMRKASATGANVAESEGLGLLDKVAEYMEKVKVREVE